VALAVWLALLAGVLQIAVGASGSAWALNLVSSPVLTGFSQAAAVLIIASQAPALVGLQGKLSSLLQAPRFDLEALGYGVASLALFEAGKRLAPRVPVVLLALAAAGGLSVATGFAARGGAVVGALPAGFPAFYWPGFPGLETFGGLIAPALVIALVSSLEMAASAKIENQREGRRWDAGQDLIGQGVGKLASAFSGSFPVSTSFSRSAITLYAGAKTGWATVFATGVVLVVLLYLTPALHHVPTAVLAAVVVTAVLGLLKPRVFVTLWKLHRAEGLIALITFAVTLLSAPRIYWGVLTGVVLGLAHFLYHRLHPRIIEVGLHPDGSLRDRRLWKLAPIAAHTFAVRMDDELDFASASALERRVTEHLSAHPDVAHLCLLAQPINRIDVTGVETFAQLLAMMRTRGGTLHLSGLKLPAEQVLRQAGLLEPGSALAMYRTDTEALMALQQLLQPSDRNA
jgi:SulP family sulfate permease